MDTLQKIDDDLVMRKKLGSDVSKGIHTVLTATQQALVDRQPFVLPVFGSPIVRDQGMSSPSHRESTLINGAAEPEEILEEEIVGF